MAWNFTLAFSRHAIFVDWNGVLNSAPFWHTLDSIDVGDDRRLILDVDQIFEDKSIVRRWMLGDKSTTDVLHAKLHLMSPSDEYTKLLREVVVQECEVAYTRRRLIAILKPLRAGNDLVLASDNMDCFAEGIARRRDLAALFDDYLISSEIRALKNDPRAFFLPWLADRGIPVSHATLIDDSAENCAAFRSIGGAAIEFDRSRRCWKLLAQLAQE